MRNISFSLTTPQFIDGSKDVTRRLGWKNLKPGDVLMGCEKCQGIKPGELKQLGAIEIVSVRREPLYQIEFEPIRHGGQRECAREGFPNLDAQQFVEMFCEHMGCDRGDLVTRIEFRRISK